ncbi:MAG: Bax inhibitor-1/YccA family protein [Mycobacteriales bacterium]
MESSNPVFGNAPALKQGYPSAAQVEAIYRTPQRLTMDDVVMRTGLLLGLVVLTGAVAWVADLGPGVVVVAALAGLALAMVNIFRREVSPPLVLAYAACEGVFLGAISKAYEGYYGGIALQAAVVTATIFGAVLFAFSRGALRATPRFTKVVTGAFVGLFALLVVNALASWIGGGNGIGLRDGGGLAILFSLAFIAFGSLTFVLDFDQAQRMVAAGVDERESWRVAFGLVVGLVWLYLEVLRLLSYLSDRR